MLSTHPRHVEGAERKRRGIQRIAQEKGGEKGRTKIVRKRGRLGRSVEACGLEKKKRKGRKGCAAAGPAWAQRRGLRLRVEEKDREKKMCGSEAGLCAA